MRNLAATILVSWLTLGMINMEKNKKMPNKKKAIFYIALVFILWVLQIYEFFNQYI